MAFSSVFFRNLTASIDKSQDLLSIDISSLSNNDESLSLATQIKNFGTKEWILEKNTFELKLADLSEFLKHFNIQSNNRFIQNVRSFKIQGECVGTPQKWQIDLSCQAPPYKFKILGNLVNQIINSRILKSKLREN